MRGSHQLLLFSADSEKNGETACPQTVTGQINFPPLLSSGSCVSSPWHFPGDRKSAAAEVDWVSGSCEEMVPALGLSSN